MSYYVYILASQAYGTLYIGMTSDLVQRIWEHKCKAVPGFTTRYGVDQLVWFETHATAEARKADQRWKRDWKISLIERENPHWADLYPTISV